MESASLSLTESYLPASVGLPPLDSTVGELLRLVAADTPHRGALISVPTAPNRAASTWTYRELLTQSEDLAHRLLLDFLPGERIGLWATNKPEWVVLQMAAALAGLVLVTLNPANRIEEMRYLLAKSACRGLFLDRGFRKLDNETIIRELKPALLTLRQVIYFDEWAKYLSGARNPAPLPSVPADSAALILFTSGTTGKPKGVVLSHRGIINNSRIALERYQLKEGSVWLAVLPFFHVGGSVTNTIGCLSNRGTQAVMSEFNPEVMLRAIATYQANLTMAVPVMVHAMLEHESFAQTDVSSLELFLTGGAVVAPQLVQVIREKFKTDVGVMFGQTEAGGTMCLTHRGDSEDHLCNTVGQPIASYELKIVDSASSQIAPVGQIGEICVRSPYTMCEYFDMPEETAKTLAADGWLHTGDLGVMRSDGYVAITGRLKDMIIRGGENIYPREVEDLLATHPAVSQAAVFGVPDVKWGEQVAAAVILKAGQRTSGEELSEFLLLKIAKPKIPKHWSFVTAFPTNPTGKIQKFVLRDQFMPSGASQ